MHTAIKKSIALHLAIFIICMVDLPLFWFNRPTVGQVPIIVDLQDVKISEMTNLPPKAKMGEEDKAASQIKRKIEEKYTQEEKAEPESKADKNEPVEEAKEEPKATPEPPKKDFLVAPQPKKPTPKKVKTPPKPAPKPVKKPEAKKQPEKKDTSKPQLANPLKSLLASVDDLEKCLG